MDPTNSSEEGLTPFGPLRKEKGVVHKIAPDQVCRSFVWFSKITTQTSVDFGQKVAGGSCLRRFAARGRSFLMGLL